MNRNHKPIKTLEKLTQVSLLQCKQNQTAIIVFTCAFDWLEQHYVVSAWMGDYGPFLAANRNPYPAKRKTKQSWITFVSQLETALINTSPTLFSGLYCKLRLLVVLFPFKDKHRPQHTDRPQTSFARRLVRRIMRE